MGAVTSQCPVVGVVIRPLEVSGPDGLPVLWGLDIQIVFDHACKLRLEGIVSKHREHPYRSGPSRAWLKIKNPDAPGVLRFKDDEP
jgi:hypothetical protein